MDEPREGPALVLFDAACPPCRSLAAWGAARGGPSGPRFLPWQEFAPSPAAARLLSPEQQRLPADRLRVLAGATLLEGAAAWTHLVAEHPSLSSLGWLARSLGLAAPEAAAGRLLMRSGDLVRRLCLRCPRR